MSGPNRRRFLKSPLAAGATFAISGTKSSGNILGANERLRIAVAGLHGRGRGDMYIEIVVETPVNLTKRQQELLKEFEQGGGTGATAPSPQAEGFFSKVKELWDDLTE